jgi:hypothetical protein
MIVTQTSGIASPLDFGGSEWLLVANALWASVIPTALRWVNKKDPAFGRVAEVVAAEVGKKLSTAAASAKKDDAAKDGDGDGIIQEGTIHERPAPKKPAAAKKTTKK